MNPACLFHWKTSEKCRHDQTLSPSGGWCWDYTSAVLGATSDALWKKQESSSCLRWPFHQTLPCFERFSMCLEASVTFCEEMEQSCWLALCSIRHVAHQVNPTECPLHVDNVGWVDVQHPGILLLLCHLLCLPLNDALGAWRTKIYSTLSPFCSAMGHYIPPHRAGCWGTAQLQFILILFFS